MKIFLKGGNGFLGKKIFSYLKKQHTVIIIDKKNYKKYYNKKCDVFINCSTNSKKYLSTFKNDFDFKNTFLNILNSIKNYKFKKYLLISSCEVYNNSSNTFKNHENIEIDFKKLTSYGFNKFLGELLVKNCDKDWIILRCNGLIGDGMKKGPFFDLIKNKKIWVNKKSNFQYLSTIHVAKIINILLKKNIKNEIFNVSGKRNIKLSKLKIITNSKSKFNSKEKIMNYNFNTNKISKIYKIPTTLQSIKETLKSL